MEMAEIAHAQLNLAIVAVVEVVPLKIHAQQILFEGMVKEKEPKHATIIILLMEMDETVHELSRVATLVLGEIHQIQIVVLKSVEMESSSIV